MLYHARWMLGWFDMYARWMLGDVMLDECYVDLIRMIRCMLGFVMWQQAW